MLAMVVNDNAGNQTPRGVLRFFASRLAPTGIFCEFNSQARPSLNCRSWLASDGGLKIDENPKGPIAGSYKTAVTVQILHGWTVAMLLG
jgi:hypothetical protein